MNLPQSLHQMLRNTMSNIKKPEDVFLLEKADGKYRTHTYADISSRINAVSAFLIKDGYQKGDRLAMILDNCPEYLVFDQALMQLGCVNASIYPTLPESDIAYILADSGAKGIIVGSPFLLKKTLKALEGKSAVEHIFLKFPLEQAKSEDPRLVALEDIFAQGEELYNEYGDQVQAAFSSVRQDDLASLIYTSGTTGVPKGVMLTHLNFMSNVWMAKDIIPSINKNDRYLSFLPLCHVYERLATYYLGIYVGAEIAFAQSIESLAHNMTEVQPTVMTTVPRLLERVKERVIKNAEGKGGISAKIFRWAVGIGEKRRKTLEAGKRVGSLLELEYTLAEKLVFTKVKARLGGRMRLLVSGGAALPQHVGEFFGNMGILALEGYGLTETSPLMAVNTEERPVYGTVGSLVAGIEVGIYDNEKNEFISVRTKEQFDPEYESEEGEIVVRGPSVMKGYWNKPQETNAVLDKEGWFHTGDVGKFYKGNLKITDRIKNMLVNAYGKNVYPTPVENVYLRSNRIEQIFLIGDKREYITAILVAPKDELKAEFHVGEEFFNDPEPFIREEEIRKWVEADIRKLSGQLAKYERIKSFTLKRTPFSIEEGELTPTLKTKRRVIESRYAEEIERLYQEISDEDY